jgi:hypothetical protein
MSLLDPKWKYTPSHATDIRERFRAERKRLAELARKADERKVTKLSERKKA